MKPVTLVFGSDRFNPRTWLLGHRTTRRQQAVVLGVLILALGVMLAALWGGWQTRVRHAEVLSNLDALRERSGQRVQARGVADAAAALSPPQRKAWGGVIDHLNIPWPAIFEALEQTLPDDIALLAVEPDALHGRIRLQFEAKSLDALLAYSGVLKSTSPFGAVLLVKHETNDVDANRPVRLSIDLRLQGATDPEIAAALSTP